MIGYEVFIGNSDNNSTINNSNINSNVKNDDNIIFEDANSKIILKSNVLDVHTYLYLREQVGWRNLSNNQATTAIKNSLYTLVAYVNNKPVGMGRIVGDGAVICYIQDLIVIPDMHGQKIGSAIITNLIEYVKSITEDGTTMMLDLMSAVSRDTFYEKFGFISRPTDTLGPGMIQYITK